MKTKQNDAKFFGSLSLLVLALVAFLFVLFKLVPEDVSESTELTTEYDQSAEAQPSADPAEDTKQLVENRSTTRSAPTQQAPVVSQQQVDDSSGARAKEEVSDSATPAEADNELIEQAISLIDEGNVEEATGILEKVLADNPNDERALVEMSMIHLIDNRDTQAAVPYLERALKVNPKQRMVLAELVNAYSEGGRIDEGMEFLTKLQEKAGGEDSSYISMGIGQMLLVDGRANEATKHLDHAVEGIKSNPDLLSNLGDTYSLVGESDKAIQTYKKAVVARKDEISRLAKAGKPTEQKQQVLLRNQIEIVREYYKRGMLDEAEEAAEAAESLLPGNHLSANWRKLIEKRRRDG